MEATMPDGLVAVLRKFYADERNITIESDWDAGFTVSIGNQRNGFAAADHFGVDELERIAPWLKKKAAELYPSA